MGKDLKSFAYIYSFIVALKLPIVKCFLLFLQFKKPLLTNFCICVKISVKIGEKAVLIWRFLKSF